MPTSWYFVNNTPVREFDKYNNAQLPNYIRTDVSVNYTFFKTPKKESILNYGTNKVWLDIIKDNKMSVAAYVQSLDKNLIVTGFKRAALG